jgi:hypothetical protein
LGRSVVVLNHDTKIFPHHVDPQRLYDFSSPVGEVREHPAKPGVWGLTNVSSRKWVSTTPEGTARDVEPGRTAAIATGTKIHFGSAEGEVRA